MTYEEALCTETARSHVRPTGGSGVRTVKAKSRKADARVWDVRLRHSSEEVREQGRASGCGADGAKDGARGKCGPASTCRAQSRITVSQALAHTAGSKEKEEGTVHRAAASHQRHSAPAGYFDLKRKAAGGVDGMTWSEYGEDLESNLAGLHNRVHRGAYPAYRGDNYIPKPDGRYATAPRAESGLGTGNLYLPWLRLHLC
jgi:hypothetical protein